MISRLRHLQGGPPYHVVMDASVHKGIDYVNGYFGPQARVDRRELHLRWMDHYLNGIDNGVAVQAPLDIFVIGDNTWRKEREWPLARTVWTNFYLRQNGRLETTAPGGEPADEYTYCEGAEVGLRHPSELAEVIGFTELICRRGDSEQYAVFGCFPRLFQFS